MRRAKIKRVIRRSTSLYGVGTTDIQNFLKGGHELHVKSSNVESAEYFPESKELKITFLKGKKREYFYQNVGKSIVEDFIAAPSKGSFVAQTFARANWPFRRG